MAIIEKIEHHAYLSDISSEDRIQDVIRLLDKAGLYYVSRLLSDLSSRVTELESKLEDAPTPDDLESLEAQISHFESGRDMFIEEFNTLQDSFRKRTIAGSEFTIARTRDVEHLMSLFHSYLD